MNAYYTIKYWLKITRWNARRASTALRWGSKGINNSPIVFGNAMPKSGSHLIIQILHGLTHIGPFVITGFPPVNRSENNHKLPDESVFNNIQKMRPGDIGYGYIGANEPFISALIQDNRATVFVYRDPRDMIISHIFYATEMQENHWMRSYYIEELESMEERINAAIVGITKPGSELTSIRKRYQDYLGWLEQPAVHSIRFEDLILEQDNTLRGILDYLEVRGFIPKCQKSEALTKLKTAIRPQKSGTFRKARPGNWREHFTENNIAMFKKETDDLLIRLNYEQDLDW